MTASSPATHAPLGVGFVGAGPVTQAIHVPTLRRLSDHFTVTHVFDVAAELAARVAEPWAAQSSTSIDGLLADPAVDVVAICSPHSFHAEQAIAACRAGKRAVLVEKPFATTPEQAREIAAASEETGTPVFVGAMHQYDPGWVRSREARSLLGTASLVRSSIVLPPNPVFEDFATEVANRTQTPPPAAVDPAQSLRDLLLGLAIHDLPLIREFVPAGAAVNVLSAEALAPGGYLVTLTAGPVLVHLHAQLPVPGTPSWTLAVDGPSSRIHTAFTPSYVHAGSATTDVFAGDTSRRFGPYSGNGYEGEWRAIASVVNGSGHPPALNDLVADLEFTIAIADGAAARMAEKTEAFA